MSKIAFGKPGTTTLVPEVPAEARNVTPVANAAEPAPATTGTATSPEPATQAVAPYAPPATPAPRSPFADDEDEAFDPGDLVIPRLAVVQKVGDLSNVFTPGDIVLNGTLVLADAGKSFDKSKPIKIVVLGIQPTTFSEKLEGGVRGRYYRTEAEVANNGGTLDWNEHKATKKALFQRVCTALLLVEQPEGIDPTAFPIAIEGKNYALALYTMKGTSYTNAARHFKTAKKTGHLKATGYRGGWWTFQSQLKKFDSNFAFIPVVNAAGSTSEKLREEVKALLGF